MDRQGRVVRLVFLTALMLVVGMLPGMALAHLQPANAVDTSTSPPEIRWLDSTTFDDARMWSINRWNSHNPVNILPDNASTLADLEFRNDVTDNGFCGYYYPWPAEDTIKYFVPSFEKLNTTQRRACATHELGHALSLGHNSDGNRDQVMDPQPTSSNPTYTAYPQSHDVSDYHAKWGY